MKNFATPAIILFAALAVFQFCVKPPDYPDEPVIAFVSLSKDFQKQAALDNNDTLYITISFTDGDGDLGSEKKGRDISLIDTRDNSRDTSSLPFINQQGAGNGISGEISIAVLPTCCVPPPIDGIPLPPCDPSVAPDFLRDTVIYQMQIRDRAGHLSNIVTLPPITVICVE